MLLKELKEYVDAYMADGCGDSSVLITLSGKSIGARQAVQVASISEGFDWESNQIRIEPQYPVVKKTDFRDKPQEIKICMSVSSRPKYLCPNCDGAIGKYDYFCRYCGQRLRFSPPKAQKHGKEIDMTVETISRWLRKIFHRRSRTVPRTVRGNRAKIIGYPVEKGIVWVDFSDDSVRFEEYE